MTLVSGHYKVYTDICWCSPRRGCQMTVGLSTTLIFGDLDIYFFGNVRGKASNITWRYATLCWPVIYCKVNDLEWYFMLKSVFGQEGCRTLTFAFARLSCHVGLPFLSTFRRSNRTLKITRILTRKPIAITQRYVRDRFAGRKRILT